MEYRTHIRGSRDRIATAAISAFLVALVAMLLVSAPASAAEQTPSLGQVERIALGSRGATVTLEGGQEIGLDFSGLAGVGGGPNYVGWAMVLFGLSVVARLLTALSRILRPFGYSGRRRRRDDE
ncbi:hypothetical protein EG835_12295 [bacterium]|nr:hypothetical protein [bacterium]